MNIFVVLVTHFDPPERYVEVAFLSKERAIEWVKNTASEDAEASGDAIDEEDAFTIKEEEDGQFTLYCDEHKITEWKIQEIFVEE